MTANKRPNILLITSDQQHWNTLGVDNPKIRTPNLDRLCREGSRFTRAYCNTPVCSPSRATIITGQYPSWHGCWTIGVKLPEDVPTVGEVFQDHGYATTLIGKAHFQPLASDPAGGQESIECQPRLRDLPFWQEFHGPWYGFEHVETARNHADESHVGQHYALWMEEKGLANWRDYFQPWPTPAREPGVPLEAQYWLRGRQRTWDLPQEFHYTTWTAERSIAAIDRSHADEKPFFLWASFHDPHPPYLVPEPWASMYDPDEMASEMGTLSSGELDAMPPHFALTQHEKPDFSPWAETPWANHGMHSHLVTPEAMRKNIAVYYGMISFMDQQIGRILARLDELGIADDTLVIFTTDHGHFLGQHGLIAKGPYHYEDLLRLPFVVRWPAGAVPAGTTNTALQALIDLPETCLSACGIPIPGQMQGVDQLPVWRGETEAARENVIVEFRHQPTRVHLRTFIEERYKMTVYRDHLEYGELFDLKADPEERRNRWDDLDYQAIKGGMFQRWINAEIVREPMRLGRIAHA